MTSTNIFIADVDPGYEWIVPGDRRADSEIWNWAMGGAAPSSAGVSVDLLRTTPQGAPRKVATMPWMGMGVLVFQREFLQKVWSVVQTWGDVVELGCKDGDYWALRVGELSGALDLEKSQVVYMPTGEILDVPRKEFASGFMHPLPFRISELRDGSIYLPREAMDVLTMSGASGTSFVSAESGLTFY